MTLFDACPLSSVADLPAAADMAALLAAERAHVELAGRVERNCMSFPVFRDGSRPLPPRPLRRHSPPMRLGVYGDAVVLGGGAVFDPLGNSIVLESIIGPSEGMFSSPERLAPSLHYLELEMTDGAIRPRQPLREPAQRLPGAFMHLTYRSDSNYTHFMLEVLPRLHYWALIPEPKPRLLVSDHVAQRLGDLLGLLGVRHEDMVAVPAVRARPLRVERLYLGSAPMWGHAEPLRLIRAAADGMPAGGRRIHVVRRGAKTWSRRLLNEERVAALLASLGFEPVTLEDFPPPRQVALFREADCIAGIYGGGLFNTIFSRRGTRLLSLTSPDYHRTIIDSLPSPLALRGATVVGESFSTKMDRNNSPFVVDMVALRSACDHLGL